MKRLIKDLLLVGGGLYLGNRLSTSLIGYAFARAETFEEKIKHVLSVAYQSNPEAYLKIFREVVSENMKEENNEQFS